MAKAQPAEEGIEVGPWSTEALVGHEAAERRLLSAFTSDRLPHGWLITGPRGIGKATLAYRFARFLFSQSADDDGGLFGDDLAPDSLAVPPEHPAFHLTAQRSHPNLRVIERRVDEKSGRLRNEITVDDIRALHSFFGMTASGGGWRVAIIDAADDLNRQAANALLKLLEEPPKKAVLILVSHAPGRLLPTIRSRCQRLPLKPLSSGDLAEVLSQQGVNIGSDDQQILEVLAAGSPGQVMELLEKGGLEIYRGMTGLMENQPQLDVGALHKFADSLNQRGGEEKFRLFSALWDGFFKRLIRAQAAGAASNPVEDALFRRLLPRASLDQWMELWENTTRLLGRATAVNLDRKHVCLIVFTQLQKLVR